MVVDERPLLQAAWHLSAALPLATAGRASLAPRARIAPYPRVRLAERRRTIRRSLGWPLRRVRPSGLPCGLTGCRPPEVLPSPPPCGWSTGFIATPRTEGRLPFQRNRPAFPQLRFDWSALPISPTVARQETETRRISPEGMRSVA